MTATKVNVRRVKVTDALLTAIAKGLDDAKPLESGVRRVRGTVTIDVDVILTTGEPSSRAGKLEPDDVWRVVLRSAGIRGKDAEIAIASAKSELARKIAELPREQVKGRTNCAGSVQVVSWKEKLA